MPSYSVSDILASPAAILYAPIGTALPDETTVAYATYASWTSWVLLGYTSAPAVLTMERETLQMYTQQVLAPVREVVTAEALTIKTTLAQFDGALLAILLGGANVNTAAGAAQKAFSEVKFGGNPQLTSYLFAIEGYRVDAVGTKQPVRVFLHQGIIKAAGDIAWDKAAMVGVPIEIHATAKTAEADGANLGVIHVVTAPASS